MQHHNPQKQRKILYLAKLTIMLSLLFVLCGLMFISSFFMPIEIQPLATDTSIGKQLQKQADVIKRSKSDPKLGMEWQAPSANGIPPGKEGELIGYGKELIEHTGKYFGPKGEIAPISNGMNCQNCHLEAGTKLFANNFSVFYTKYPVQGARSGKIDQVTDRISDCFQRSLAGKMPEKSSKEIRAMIAYFKWVGQGVKKGQKLSGTATERLPFLERAANPQKGLLVYRSKCQTCHGKNGEGLMSVDQKTYVNPPLWGPHSYNDAAGMHRLIQFSGFVKNNMPYGANHKNPQLSVDEAWDVAAFVNTRPRPHKDQRKDYPDLTKKPIDAPYGPYPDNFSAQQHKLGPFKPITEFAKGLEKNNLQVAQTSKP
jgi:thiosulfate dehydrogenase